MQCMKCGKDTGATQVFCEECLAVMETQPVRVGTSVVIPQRPPITRPNARKKGKSPEEELAFLQKRVRRLTFTVIVLLACLCASLSILSHTRQVAAEQSNMGKNYSTVAPAEGT